MFEIEYNSMNTIVIIRRKEGISYEVNGVILKNPMVTTINSEKTTYEVGGKLHRTDGPAIEYANGRKEYYFEGKLHLTDGPAVICVNGDKRYFIDGIQIKPKYIERFN
jgi:hypothetical protein